MLLLKIIYQLYYNSIGECASTSPAGGGWLLELPDEDELGLSFAASFALKLLVKVWACWEHSEPESKLEDPNNLPHLLVRPVGCLVNLVVTVPPLSSFSATEESFVVDITFTNDLSFSSPWVGMEIFTVYHAWVHLGTHSKKIYIYT